MTITVTASGISLDGPLVAGEVVAVSVSGVAFAEDAKPTLCLLGRFPDALLSSVELTEDENTPGTWTGELDTATKQTAAFFAAARADEKRDAVLELVAARQSIARLSVSFANSALCPSPFHAPDASPVYVPVPGPPGQGGDPYDQNPAMDGIASAGVSDKYARGDHVHPTDSSRAAQADVAAIQDVIPSTATPSNKLATAADLTGKANDADVVKLTGNQTIAGDKTFTGQVTAADIVTGYSVSFLGTDKYITAPENSGAALTDADLSDSSSALATALLAKADTSSLATVATTGDYGDLLNKPTIPAAQVNADWNASSGVAQILNKPTIPDVSGKADSAAIAPAFSTSSTYAVGDYCTHEGLLYKCTTAVSTAGAWDATDWTAVSAMAEVPAPGAPNHKIWAANPDSSSTQSVLKLTPFGGDFAVEEGVVVVFRSNVTNAAGVKINVGGTGDKSVYDKGLVYGGTSLAAGVIQQGCVYAVSYWALGNGIWVLEGTTYAPIASPTFTGTPKAPTAAAWTNTTQVATTAFVQTAVAGKLASAERNLLAYASTMTLDPATAVYRATATLSGTTATMPTVTITGIPTAAAYFAFELEVAVDATATALDQTAWSGWTWMDGGELPTADYAGKTLYIACRLDCTARTIVANCYDVR